MLVNDIYNFIEPPPTQQTLQNRNIWSDGSHNIVISKLSLPNISMSSNGNHPRPKSQIIKKRPPQDDEAQVVQILRASTGNMQENALVSPSVANEPYISKLSICLQIFLSTPLPTSPHPTTHHLNLELPALGNSHLLRPKSKAISSSQH